MRRPEVGRGAARSCVVAGDASGTRTAEAARHFERTIAADATALLCELRAMTSLCRIGGEPARARLARLVDRLAPGDDCADLRAARALL